VLAKRRQGREEKMKTVARGERREPRIFLQKFGTPLLFLLNFIS